MCCDEVNKLGKSHDDEVIKASFSYNVNTCKVSLCQQVPMHMLSKPVLALVGLQKNLAHAYQKVTKILGQFGEPSSQNLINQASLP